MDSNRFVIIPLVMVNSVKLASFRAIANQDATSVPNAVQFENLTATNNPCAPIRKLPYNFDTLAYSRILDGTSSGNSRFS